MDSGAIRNNAWSSESRQTCLDDRVVTGKDTVNASVPGKAFIRIGRGGVSVFETNVNAGRESEAEAPRPFS